MVLAKKQGFTLIELLIVIAIISILAAIAIPNYQDYILRARLTEAATALSAMRAKMEQHFLDNRTYATAGSFTSPCLTSTTAGLFQVVCLQADAPTAIAYKITATGSGIAANFVYTIDQAGTKATTQTKWNTASTSCWLMTKSSSC